MAEHRKRPLPEITWENITPPYLDHAYFEGGTSFPFRTAVRGFDKVNAWWLAEMATLVYADPPFAETFLDRAGFASYRFFSGNSTQCYVADAGDFAVAAFRGTETRPRGDGGFEPVLADIMTDVDIRLVSSGRSGKVHKGFRNALEEVWGELMPHLEKLAADGRLIWLTGHSLGAALATLAADRLSGVQGVYTFGSPRVGDRKFADGYGASIYRFVHRYDIVCRLPPSPPYAHVGELHDIGADGMKNGSAMRRYDPAARIRNELHRFFTTLGQERRDIGDRIPDEIRDHVPLYYTVHLWNALGEP